MDKNYRGKGIGSSILADLVKNTESCSLNVVNVDSQCDSMKDFLLNLGFKLMIKQYEMILAL